MNDRANLGSASLLHLHGVDARSFCQAQFCNDVTALGASDWQWNGWLDVKGRLRYFFALIDRDDGGLWIWLPLGDASELANELRRFLFRAKLKINVIEGWGLLGNFAPSTSDARLGQGDDGFWLHLDGVQARSIHFAADLTGLADEAALQRWRACDVYDGLPLIDRACAGQFVPQALAMESVAAISFRKGCYPGQEIAARLHFRGGNKRHPRKVRWDAGNAVAEVGMSLHHADDDASRGQLLYSGADADGPIGLAILSEASEATAPLRMNGIEVHVVDEH